MTNTTHGHDAKRQKTRSGVKKNLFLNAFLMSSPGNQVINSWRNENDKTSHSAEDPQYWIKLAELLEKGGFTTAFFADVLGPYDVYNGPGNFVPVAKAGSQWPVPDPSYYIPLMAAVTKRLTFGITMSTISEQPYHLARRLGTLDLITKGRVGWNVVTSYLDSASKNLLNGKPLPDKNERYEIAEEYVDVVYKLLLSSWRDDAVKADKETGVYTDPNALRTINHEGKYFTVPGPAITQPSQQKLPVIIQAGLSPKGQELAARNAEVVFLSNPSKESLKKAIDSIKHLAEHKYKRDPTKIKFVVLVTIIIADTTEEAKEEEARIRAAGNPEAAKAMFSGWGGVDIGSYSNEKPLEDLNNAAVVSLIQVWKEAYPDIKVWNQKVIVDQVTIGGLGTLFSGTVNEVADRIEAVSYTHLDVYKRQVIITQ